MNCPVPYWRMRSLIRRERFESEEVQALTSFCSAFGTGFFSSGAAAESLSSKAVAFFVGASQLEHEPHIIPLLLHARKLFGGHNSSRARALSHLTLYHLAWVLSLPYWCDSTESGMLPDGFFRIQKWPNLFELFINSDIKLRFKIFVCYIIQHGCQII